MRRSAVVQSSSPITQPAAAGPFQMLPLTEIHESAALMNPRATFDQAALEELAGSIRQRGVLQPIVVRPRVEDGGGYELIAGARRLRAARLADLATIPAHVVNLDDQAARETAIIENLQRQDVHPLEEAEAYQQLMASDPLVTADTIAAKVGKSATYVYSRLMLLRLEPDIRDAFRRDVITAAHAHRLSTVPAERQAEAFARCFFNLLATDDDGANRNNLAPMKQLDEWLHTRVALNVHHEDTTRFLPTLAEAVTEQEQAGAEILALSTLTYHTGSPANPNPSWRAVGWRRTRRRSGAPTHDRASSCSVRIAGDDHRLHREKQCAKHWGKTSDRATQRHADDTKREAAAQGGVRRGPAWNASGSSGSSSCVPPLSAIVEKAKQQKTITRALVLALLDTVTSRDEELRAGADRWRSCRRIGSRWRS